MAQERYYRIIPKDNDPEVAADLMFKQGWPPSSVLINISQLLAGR